MKGHLPISGARYSMIQAAPSRIAVKMTNLPLLVRYQGFPRSAGSSCTWPGLPWPLSSWPADFADPTPAVLLTPALAVLGPWSWPSASSWASSGTSLGSTKSFFSPPFPRALSQPPARPVPSILSCAAPPPASVSFSRSDMIATLPPLTPGRRPTAFLILVAQDAQSIPVTVHSTVAAPVAPAVGVFLSDMIDPPPEPGQLPLLIREHKVSSSYSFKRYFCADHRKTGRCGRRQGANDPLL